ncbi:MAG: hypothetical protein QXW80_06940 [Candidatus Micrarchaeia archaeon]
MILYMVVILILAVIIVYLLVSSFYNGQISALQTSLNNAQVNYSKAENQLTHPYTQVLFSNKTVLLQSLTYPQQYTYNSSYIEYFYPTHSYIYYDNNSGVYYPLFWINASYSEFNFNVTEPGDGYIIVNYTTSGGGLSLASSDCLANLFALGTVSLASEVNIHQHGSLTVQVPKGKTCLTLENPSNHEISVTFSATFIQYP